MRTKYKKWAVDYLHSNFDHELNDESLTTENLLKIFSNKDVYLEIGPGKGQFIIEMASKFPNLTFLVIELNQTIAGMCLKNIDENELDNVYLIQGNYFKYVEILKKVKFCGIFLNFSDPWPKRKHEKRRLTSDDFIKSYIEILKDDGLIYFKSDNYGFYEYSKTQFDKFHFETIFESNDYNMLDDFDAETEFEQKFKEKGVKINRLILKKNENCKKEIEKL